MDVNKQELYQRVIHKGITYIERLIATKDSVEYPSVELQHQEYLRSRELLNRKP